VGIIKGKRVGYSKKEGRKEHREGCKE